MTELRLATDVQNTKLVDFARSDNPTSLDDTTALPWIESGSFAQFDDREMPSIWTEADVKIESSTAPTANLHLRLSTGRTSRPTSPRLEPRCATSDRFPEVDFIGSSAVEPSMRAIPVVPGNEQRQLSSKCIPAVRDDHLPCAFVLDCPDEPFDDGDTSVLADGTESLADTLSTAPPPKRLVTKLLALVRDQVSWRHSGSLNDSAKKRPDGHGRGLLVEHGEPHDAT